jgi:hypothetical protein
VKAINGLFARAARFRATGTGSRDESPSNKPDGSSGQQIAVDG